MYIKRALASVAVLVFWHGNAIAGQLEDGVAAEQRRDYATALTLLRPLAEQGNSHAQFELGEIYVEGKGVPQDFAEAIKWYRKAAEQGDDVAMRMLGLMYRTGRQVPQDYTEAMKWYRKAAEQRSVDAQCKLGNMYEEGQGVPQDFVQAHKWYNLASAQGDLIGARLRDLVAQRMTPGQIAEAQALARNWKPNTVK